MSAAQNSNRDPDSKNEKRLQLAKLLGFLLARAWIKDRESRNRST